MTDTSIERLEAHAQTDEEEIKNLLRLGKIQHPTGVLQWINDGFDIDTAIGIQTLPNDVPNTIAEYIAKHDSEWLRDHTKLKECMEVRCSVCHEVLYRIECIQTGIRNSHMLFVNDSEEWMTTWNHDEINVPEDANTDRCLTAEYITDCSAMGLIEVDNSKEGVVCGVCSANGTGRTPTTSVKKYIRAFDGNNTRATQFACIPTTTVIRHDWYYLNGSNKTPSGNRWNEPGDVFPFGGAYSLELFRAYAGTHEKSLREYLDDQNWVVLCVDDIIAYADAMNELVDECDTSLIDDLEDNEPITHDETMNIRSVRKKIEDMIETMGSNDEAIPIIDFTYAVDKGREMWCDKSNRLRLLDEMLRHAFNKLDKTEAELTYEELITNEETPGTSKAVEDTYYSQVCGDESNESGGV